MITETDYLILGAGVTGLAAANVLGPRAKVLEREARPGGLVRTECFNGYWFDHVLHILYFADCVTERRIQDMLGETLAPCVPIAFVETRSGTTRYPFQMHLEGLDEDTVIRCLHDLARVAFGPAPGEPRDFQEMLLHAFGREMCEVFMFPYNRKVWRRPLTELADSDFTWNIPSPDFDHVLRGALGKNQAYRPYNACAWYPCPPAAAPWRGMEVLVRALASQVVDLRLEHCIEDVDLERRVVTALHAGRTKQYRFRRGCLSTLPLSTMIEICRPAPHALRQACRRLKRNRVVSVMLSIAGPRPTGRGHWRYYADESLIFTRLIHTHEFDPAMAPADGWGLMAEVMQRSEDPEECPETIIRKTVADVHKAGALSPHSQIIDAHLRVTDPAYVVFSVDSLPIIELARRYLEVNGIVPLGRYGRWEHSSMAQGMSDGFGWADRVLPTTRVGVPRPRQAVVRSRTAVNQER